MTRGDLLYEKNKGFNVINYNGACGRLWEEGNR